MSSSPSVTSSRLAHSGSGRAVYRTLCATLVLLLGACAAPGPAPTKPPDATLPAVAEDRPEALLARAERAGAAEAALLRLQAAEAWADAGRVELLAGVLAPLDEGALPPDARPRLTLLRALDALERGDADRALVLLRATPDARYDSTRDGAGVVRASRIRARVLAAADRPLAAVREWVFVEGLLEDAEERRAVRELLWRTLTSLDPDLLAQTLAGLGHEPVLRGWLELADVALGLHPTLEAQLAAVDRWRRRWPGHPAADPLPERIARLPALLEGRPRRVALLLPLSGPLAAAGEAVRDGFLAAHFEALASGAATPRITVFDSAAQEPGAAYLRAVDAGAELVVGPLAKDAVDAVAALPAREVPVLALNTASGASAADLIQFGLLPEDEGRQIAELAHGAGHRRALAVVDRAPWAQRLADAFRDRFEALGGTVVATRTFSAARGIGDAVADGLLVHDSEARARELRRVLGDRFEFEPRPRGDLDFVFAGVDPVAGRTLKPALEYYFSGNLPVYASSHVYDGGPQDEDLDGIRFCDMPWRLVALPTRQEIERAGEDAGRGNAPFYALGVDAWRLHARLEALRAGERVAGVTGTLRLDPEGRLTRALDWAIIRAGRAVPLPRVATAGP
jgi:outer membrane PBP1 activator LpoA protein